MTDDAVTHCFYVLRRQLSQVGGDWRYRRMFETLPKRGYRFTGEITRLEPQPVAGAGQSGRRHPLTIAVAIVTAIALVVIVI